MHINSKLPEVGSSIFSTMSAMSRAENATNLGQGFPDFPVDPALIENVNLAMQKGYNQYPPMQGIPELRNKVAEIINHKYRRSVQEEQITITAGATQAIFNTITAFVHEGDEVLILDPAYDCYDPAIQLVGAKPIHVQMDIKSGTIPEEQIRNKINNKTKMIVWNNPHNPTGNVFGRKAIEFFENIAKKHQNIIFLSDEVYEHIDFTDSFMSAHQSPVLQERSVVISSFGKTFHATGWKIGYAVAEQPLIKEFNKVHQYNVFAVNHAVQKGLSEYISTEKTNIAPMYQQKRTLLTDALKKSRFNLVGGGGTYFQMLDYSSISEESDVDFTQKLIRENKITTIPISVFNKNGKDQNIIRICFAKEDKTLKKAAEILCKI